MQALLEAGADARAKDARGREAAHFAGAAALLPVLARAGADLRAKSEDGSPAKVAKARGDLEVRSEVKK